MNVCSFIGRFGRDPEMRYTTSGKAVTSFSLGVNRDGKKDETDWINFVAWEKTAEVIAKYCHKGDLIGVTGSLMQRDYEDKNGNKRTVHEVRVNRGGKKGDSYEAPASGGFAPISEDDGDLPF